MATQYWHQLKSSNVDLSYDTVTRRFTFRGITVAGTSTLPQTMVHVADPTTGQECADAIATIIDGLKALGIMAPDP